MAAPNHSTDRAANPDRRLDVGNPGADSRDCRNRMHPGCTAVGGPGSRCGKRCTTSERSRTNCSIVCGKRCPGIVLVGHPAERLPNTLNVLFPRVSGRKLLEACPQVLASTGSA